MNIGDRLITPDNGYKRIDNTNVNILYVGIWDRTPIEAKYYNAGYYGYYNSTKICASGKDEYLEFKVYTSKIRLFVGMYITCNINNNHSIYIDNVLLSNQSSYLNTGLPTIGQRLLFEKNDMIKTIHTIKILNNDAGELVFDCVDIDDDGFILSKEKYDNYKKQNSIIKQFLN